MPLRLPFLLAAFALTSLSLARDVSSLNPPFPRIGNCYAAGLGWMTWDKGAEYWSKLDLFIGGGYDVHYDWDNPRWPQTLARVQDNITRLRQVNPTALILPYVDVIEGPDNPKLPQNWWDLNAKGERWSGWPGMFRINTKLPEVLKFNLDQVRENVLGREMFDGVFYDCWSPDKWLVPETAKLRDGKTIVMLNAWNLPTTGFADLNGCLAEDEINRVIEGKVDFEDFLHRYLCWSTESRKPVVTMLVCHPRAINDDPWRWAKMTHEERKALQDRSRTEDSQTMRFGLATTLMGDGYFGYDCGTSGRGNWWWYPEYDAPLGHPKAAAHRNPDGTYQRDFDGGTVLVNGSRYDAVVDLPAKHKDVSTDRVGTRFTLPMFDGRIFLPTAEPVTTTPDIAPRLTATPPAKLRAATLDDKTTVIQTPGGLDLRFNAAGDLRAILWHGRSLMTGGSPEVASPPWKSFRPENVTSALAADDTQARLTFRGQLVEGAGRASFTETCTVTPDSRFALHFDFEALTDLNIRLWRHFFMFPVSRYAGASATGNGKTFALPATLGQDPLLENSKQVEIATQDARLSIESSIPLSLGDHRKWGTQDYLLAGYPVNGAVKQGRKWSVDIAVTVAAP